LVERGLLTPDQKLETLELQARQDARFGELVVSRGLLSPYAVNQALAAAFETGVADFVADPPELALIERYGLDRALETGHLPWRRQDGVVQIASARPETFDDHRPDFEAAFGPVDMVITSERELHQAVIGHRPPSLTAKAETRVPEPDSCRSQSRVYARAILIGALCFGVAMALAPKLLLFGVLFSALLILMLQSALTAAAFARHWIAGRSAAEDIANPRPMTRLPVVSLLVPLYKEREIASRLTGRLSQLDYPSELLDICLIVEADDRTTQDALDAIALPRGFRQIVVPEGTLKTKPRALNYALDFCKGAIVGVYDAEDAPDRDQIRRVVTRFHHAPPEVACLQGVLDYYNPHRNWLARCFTIEYAAWFRVILPAYLRLGLVIPLGGTTLFFRRPILEALGGWDAHNVTEDADLGIRLARRGYRTELIETVTMEEANCKLWPWVKQRSRWLKGYAVTWAVHSRKPLRLWRDLGAWRFFGVHLLLLGTLLQFAVAPLLWSFWLVLFGIGHPLTAGVPTPLIWSVAAIFFLSEVLSIAVRLTGVRRTKHLGLARWVPSLYVYFPLATVAVYKGLWELLTKPFYWDKTTHGSFSEPPTDPPGPHRA